MIKIASIWDVPVNDLIEAAAKELAKSAEMKAPAWTVFAKTGTHKERPPMRNDWWEIRAAAILRRLYMKGPLGVSKIRTMYGGKKDRGMQPEIYKRGSGSVARKILQQLEKAGFAKQAEKDTHKGRLITPKGKALMDKAATAVQKTIPKKKPISSEKPVQPKKEEKAEAKKDVKTEAKEKVVEKASPEQGKEQAKKEKVEEKAPEVKEKAEEKASPEKGGEPVKEANAKSPEPKKEESK